MAKTVHIVRHAQGYHQLPLGHPDTSHLDPELTPYGLKQAAHFSQNFQLHGKIDLLCTSPMKRTIRTALVAFKQDVDNGHRIVLLPDAQEATDVPSDTGSKIEELQRVFGDVIDTTHLHTDWYLKRGVNATDTVTLRARAARLRTWLRKQLANEIVLVTHGFFAHFLTGNIDEAGEQTGAYWANVRWRSFHFLDDEEASLSETEDSQRRTAAGEALEHPFQSPRLKHA